MNRGEQKGGRLLVGTSGLFTSVIMSLCTCFHNNYYDCIYLGVGVCNRNCILCRQFVLK